MASLEKCTDTLLRHKAIQNSHCEHLQNQIRASESQKSASMVHLKLLVGDVRRRLRDMDEVRESITRLDDQLHNRKVKLSGTMVLLQQNMHKYEELLGTIRQSAARWHGFPQELSQLMRALQERRTLQKDSRLLIRVVCQASHVYIATWHLNFSQQRVMNEFALQKGVVQRCMDRLRIEALQTAEEITQLEGLAAATSDVQQTTLQNVQTLQRQLATVTATNRRQMDVILPGLAERRDSAQCMTREAEQDALTLEESCAGLATRLRVEHETLDRLTSTRVALTQTISELHCHRAETLQQLAKQHEALCQRLDQVRDEAQESSKRYAVTAADRQKRLLALSATLSLADAVVLRHHRHAEQLAQQRLDIRASQERLAPLRERHAAALQRQWEEARRRRCAELLAAVEAEECLTRRPLQDDTLLALASVHAMEQSARSRLRAQRVASEPRASAQSAKKVLSKRPKPAKRQRRTHQSRSVSLSQSPATRSSKFETGLRSSSPSVASSLGGKTAYPFMAGAATSTATGATFTSLFHTPQKPTRLRQPPLPRPSYPPSSTKNPKTSNRAKKRSAEVLKKSSQRAIASPVPRAPVESSALSSALLKQHTQRNAVGSDAVKPKSARNFPLDSLKNSDDLFMYVY